MYKKWGVEFESSDEGDAFIIGQVGASLLDVPGCPRTSGSESLLYEQQAIATLLKGALKGREQEILECREQFKRWSKE